MYTVLGLMIAWGLTVAVRGERMPQWQTEKFLALPPMVRATRVRRARRAGIALAVMCFLVSIAYGAAESYIERHQQRMSSVSDSDRAR